MDLPEVRAQISVLRQSSLLELHNSRFAPTDEDMIVFVMDLDELGEIDQRSTEAFRFLKSGRPSTIIILAVGREPVDLNLFGGVVDGICQKPSEDTFDAWYTALQPLLVSIKYPDYQDELSSEETQGGVSREEFDERLREDREEYVEKRYRLVMAGSMESDLFTANAKFTVRLWDGMDGCWCDCAKDVSKEEALKVWADRTKNGTEKVSFSEIDYYRIFPGGTRMKWNGDEGREMFR